MSHDTDDRGYHFLKILDEGKRFTTELLKENESLRMANVKLKDDLRERDEQLKRAQGFDYERTLGQLVRERNEALEKLDGLRAYLASVEAENRDFAERYLRIEKQNGNLASLYVATYNLHSTLNIGEVLNCIREIVINLIGSEMFGVYVAEPESSALTLLAHEGLDDPRYRTLARTGLVDDALSSGRAVTEDGAEAGSDLVACAPLLIHDQVLGVIAIYRLLDHKGGFEALDRELLDMLAGHAATALYSARLHAQAARKLFTLESFFELLKFKKEPVVEE